MFSRSRVAQLVDRAEVGAQLFGELVVQFGNAASLDSLDADFVCHGLAGQSLVGEVVGVFHLEAALLAGLGAAKVLGELRNGILRRRSPPSPRPLQPAWHRVLVRLLGRAFKADHGEVAVSQRTLFFHRAVGGMLLAQVLQSVLHFFFAHVGVKSLDVDVVVGSDLKSGNTSKDAVNFSGSPSCR